MRQETSDRAVPVPRTVLELALCWTCFHGADALLLTPIELICRSDRAAAVRRLGMNDIKFTTGLSAVADARVAFRGTPFVERTAPLNQNALWMRWDRNMVVDSYSDMVEELSA